MRGSVINGSGGCESLLISWPRCRAAFPGSWNTLPPSSLSRGSVSSLRTPMHRSITLNQPDNSIERGNWHHLLLVGLVGDWQMIGPVSGAVRAVYHCVRVLLTWLSVFSLRDPTIPQTMEACRFMSNSYTHAHTHASLIISIRLRNDTIPQTCNSCYML